MDDSATPLPTTLAECQAKISELTAANSQQQATIAEQQITIGEQQSLLQALQRDIALMKRTLFGQRRERFEDPRQGTLFDAVAVGGAEPDEPAHADNLAVDASHEDDPSNPEADSNSDDEKSSRRGGRGRRVIPESLPRIQRTHELDDAEIPEGLSEAGGRRFLKKVGEFVELEPARLIVVEEFVEVLAVDNADATETKMVSAPRPPRILTCFAGPGLLAGLATHHFADHLPYYRLEEILERSHLVLDRSTVCRWMIRLAGELTPLTDLMRSLALQSLVVQADETPIKMLMPGQGKNVNDVFVGDPRRSATSLHDIFVHRESCPSWPRRVLRGLLRHARVGRLHWLRVSASLHARPDSSCRLPCACAPQVRGVAFTRSDRADGDGHGLLPASVRHRG